MSRARRASITLMVLVLAGMIGTTAPAQEPPAESGGPLHYFTVKPCRLLDTRRGDQGGPLITDQTVTAGSVTTRFFKVRGKCDVPDAARAVAVNITVAAKNQTFFGHLVAFASNIPLPDTSNVNFSPSTAIANFAIVELGPHLPDLAIHIFLADRDIPSLGAPVELIIDVVGYLK